MSVGLNHITKALLIVFVLVLVPSVAATCTIEARASCSDPNVAVASVSEGTNGHAAPTSHTDFPNVLCCEADFSEGYYGTNEIFSITTIDGQGHIGEPGQFDYPINGSYNNCVIEPRNEDSARGEVCVADT